MVDKTQKKPTRSQIIAGNWKMYKTIEEAEAFVETLAPYVKKSQVAVYLAVPFTAIHPVVNRVQKMNAPIVVGAQNMNDATEGAFTGEIAGKMLRDVGARFVILGHSERRHLFHESDAFINRKIKRALADGLQPILCVGETSEQREQGETELVLKEQLIASLEGISKEEAKELVVAYEPVWAIGTGKVASPEDAQKGHAFCRSILEGLFGKRVTNKLPILYGGSVKPENAATLIAEKDVDGLLVGGASLKPHTFGEIINHVQETS